jgi:hypothetical protein
VTRPLGRARSVAKAALTLRINSGPGFFRGMV